MIYSLVSAEINNVQKQICINRPIDNACIPFDPANTDYQQFKKDLSNGVALNDAEGNAMTAEQITAFLGELK